jgi:hypothetical protein
VTTGRRDCVESARLLGGTVWRRDRGTPYATATHAPARDTTTSTKCAASSRSSLLRSVDCIVSDDRSKTSTTRKSAPCTTTSAMFGPDLKNRFDPHPAAAVRSVTPEIAFAFRCEPGMLSEHQRRRRRRLSIPDWPVSRRRGSARPTLELPARSHANPPGRSHLRSRDHRRRRWHRDPHHRRRNRGPRSTNTKPTTPWRQLPIPRRPSRRHVARLSCQCQHRGDSARTLGRRWPVPDRDTDRAPRLADRTRVEPRRHAPADPRL